MTQQKKDLVLFPGGFVEACTGNEKYNYLYHDKWSYLIY